VTYRQTIGVETHVELNTDSKMFCGCSARFGDPPNTNICPVCLGLPGSLPVPNRRAIEAILSIGLTLGCEVTETSIFHRKNYFYADMPKNYQISQYDVPICRGGYLELEGDGATRRIRIHRVHMEEDTGKSLHVGKGGRIHAADHTLIDFNRAGVPLVEIVTEPDIRSASEARHYATDLRDLVLALGVSDAKLEEGSIRFDANVSVSPEGSARLGTKVEIKNMNSFRSVERAIAYEVDRQTSLLEAGQAVVQETRHWDEEAGVTQGMRSKEESSDYRYFPEPDLVPIHVPAEWLEEIRRRLPDTPAQRRSRLMSIGLDLEQASTLSRTDPLLSEWLLEATDHGAPPVVVANWLIGEVTAYLRKEGISASETGLNGPRLASLFELVERGTLSSTAAKEVLLAVAAGGGEPEAVAVAHDLIQISDRGELGQAVDRVLAAHPGELARVRAGDERLIGFLIGQVMRETGGRADPKAAAELIRARVD